jgi:hypothetical protein
VHAAAAQEKCVGEGRRDFFDVVCDEHESRRAWATCERVDKLEKLCARYGIEPRAWLVENEQARLRHQGTRDQDALAFSLRKLTPKPGSESACAYALEEAQGGTAVGYEGFCPERELRVFAADDGGEHGFIGRHAGLERTGNEADAKT